jgi:hypothetical protein
VKWACIYSYKGNVNRRIVIQAGQGINLKPSLKIPKAIRDGMEVWFEL